MVLLGAFSLVSLQGCGEKSEPSTTTLTTTTTPSGRTSCWVKTGSVKEARTKPCDKSKGSTWVVVFVYFCCLCMFVLFFL